MFRWEFATACAGIILGINPFDEPNVQEAKDNTKRILDKYAREKKMPIGERWLRSHPELPSILKDFLDSLKSGDYLGLNVFLSPSAENRHALQIIRSSCLIVFMWQPHWDSVLVIFIPPVRFTRAARLTVRLFRSPLMMRRISLFRGNPILSAC